MLLTLLLFFRKVLGADLNVICGRTLVTYDVSVWEKSHVSIRFVSTTFLGGEPLTINHWQESLVDDDNSTAAINN